MVRLLRAYARITSSHTASEYDEKEGSTAATPASARTTTDPPIVTSSRRKRSAQQQQQWHCTACMQSDLLSPPHGMAAETQTHTIGRRSLKVRVGETVGETAGQDRGWGEGGRTCM